MASKFTTLVGLALCLLMGSTQAFYFYLEKDNTKCFKDEIVKSSVRRPP
jgi:hypothetical protein